MKLRQAASATTAWESYHRVQYTCLKAEYNIDPGGTPTCNHYSFILTPSQSPPFAVTVPSPWIKLFSMSSGFFLQKTMWHYKPDPTNPQAPVIHTHLNVTVVSFLFVCLFLYSSEMDLCCPMVLFTDNVKKDQKCY